MRAGFQPAGDKGLDPDPIAGQYLFGDIADAVRLETKARGVCAFAWADLTGPQGHPDGREELLVPSGDHWGFKSGPMQVFRQVGSAFRPDDFVPLSLPGLEVVTYDTRAIGTSQWSAQVPPGLVVVGTGSREQDWVLAWDGARYVDLNAAGCPADDGLFGLAKDLDTFGLGLLDYDLDGDWDLYRVNGGDLSNRLFTNTGRVGGLPCFALAGAVGVAYAPHTGRGLAVGDLDRNGRPDLVSSGSDTRIYLNHTLEADGPRFVRYDFDPHGSGTRNFQAPVLFDADNDGDLDLALPAWTRASPSRIYENRLVPDGSFSLRDATSEVTACLDMDLMTGAYAGDYDNDGDLDLFYTSHDHDNRIYRNEHISTDGRVTAGFPGFTLIEDPGLIFRTGSQSYSADFVDHDLDGDLDLWIGNMARNDASFAGLYLVRNHYRELGGDHRVYRVRVVIDGKERVPGTLVEVVYGPHVQLRQLAPVQGFGVQHQAVLHFGVGAHPVVDEVRVFAPGDRVPTRVFTDRPTHSTGKVVDVLKIER